MKLIFNFIIILFSGTTFSFSQGFYRTFGNSGGETGTCIKKTLDNNYIISGTSSSFSNGYSDFYLLKINPSGNVLWSKSYGTTYKESNYFVSTCSDGGYILTGSTEKFGAGINTDLYLIKVDSLGNLSWSQSVGGNKEDYGWYVTESNDGGFLTVGGTNSFNGGNWDGYIVKTDSLGKLMWSKSIGGSSTDYFHGMSQTSDGGYIVTGVITSNSFGSSDIWLVKLNSLGDTLWTRQYGKSTEDAGNAVAQTLDGGYIVAGDIHFNFGSGDHNMCLLKTDSVGNIQWAKTYGSNPGTEIAWYVRQNADKSYIVGGSSAYYGNGGGGDIVLINSDSLGNIIWSKSYGGTAFDDFWLLEETKDKGNIIVGTTLEGGNDILVIKTDSIGNTTCNTNIINPNINIPSLSTRSGTSIVTGGTSFSPTTLTFSTSTLAFDPCSLTSANELITGEFQHYFYPNPFKDFATLITSPITEQVLELKIYDLLGNYISGQKIYTTTTPIYFHSSSGFYFYTLTSPANTYYGKFIVK